MGISSVIFALVAWPIACSSSDATETVSATSGGGGAGAGPLDAGSDASADAGSEEPPCGTTGVLVGEFATSPGRVNLHREGVGPWSPDDDCSSSAGDADNYCRKYWPTTFSQVQLPVVDEKPFVDYGGTAPQCGGVHTERGTTHVACCAVKPCPDGLELVGVYATWSGKVNLHRPVDGNWATDPDCCSADESLAYCKKFWPTSTATREIAVEPGDKPFTAGHPCPTDLEAPACGGIYAGAGWNEWSCCAPK